MKEFHVGLMALVAIAFIVVISFKITSRKSAFGKNITYRAILKDASGIYEKAAVSVAGIRSGRVKQIQIFQDQALISFEISESVKVTKGSKLQVKSVGFLGEKYIDIILNKKEHHRLEEESIIPVVDTAGIEAITKDVSTILSDIKSIVSGLREIIGKDGKDDISPLASIMYDVGGIAENLAYEFDSSREKSFISSVKKASEVVDNIRSASDDFKIVMNRLERRGGLSGQIAW